MENYIVTLLPVQRENLNEVLIHINSRDFSSPKFLFGVTDNNHRIAMLPNSKFYTDDFGIKSSIKFVTPVIITAFGNLSSFYDSLTEDWSKFHTITFRGGHTNTIYNPRIAIEQGIFDKLDDNGMRLIKIRSWSDYTHSLEIEIDGEKAEFMISVLQSNVYDREKVQSYSLGELDSFIRFSFEKAQNFDKF